jgi:hypothetical protein
MEDGRRLENLSWRLWNRETFCCESATLRASAPPTLAPSIAIKSKTKSKLATEGLPELSSSVESLADDETERIECQSSVHPLDIQTPRIRRLESMSRSRGTEKHITSYGLEKLVTTIKEQQDLPKPTPSPARPIMTDRTPRSASMTNTVTKTPSTADAGSTESFPSDTPAVGSETSVNSEFSDHSVVRGFTPGKSISSYKSQTQLAPPAPSQPIVVLSKADEPKRKTPNFMLGGESSTEEESSFDSSMKSKGPHRSSLSSGSKRSMHNRKQTSFKDVVATRTINEGTHEDEAALYSDEEDDVSESAIDEDDSSDWEDSATESGESEAPEKQLFQRVDSRPTLTSRRSLLTAMVHQTDRASAFAMKASKSTPALQRSRTSSPNGPSLAASPEDESTLTMRGPDIPRSKPIIMTTSNIHQPPLSPRTTRRNMLASELSESLRKHLIRERQQKNSTAAAVLKRCHTTQDVANLQDYPSQVSSKDMSKNNSWNHYLDDGASGYHQKGW